MPAGQGAQAQQTPQPLQTAPTGGFGGASMRSRSTRGVLAGGTGGRCGIEPTVCPDPRRAVSESAGFARFNSVWIEGQGCKVDR